MKTPLLVIREKANIVSTNPEPTQNSFLQIHKPHHPGNKYRLRVIIPNSNTKGGPGDLKCSQPVGITNIGSKSGKGRNVKDAPRINKGFLKQTTSSSPSHLKNNDFHKLAYLGREEWQDPLAKNISFLNDRKSIYHRLSWQDNDADPESVFSSGPIEGSGDFLNPWMKVWAYPSIVYSSGIPKLGGTWRLRELSDEDH